MADTYRRGLIGQEDFSQGTGTFQRTTSTGGQQTLQKIPTPFTSGATANSTAVRTAGGDLFQRRVGIQSASHSGTEFALSAGWGNGALKGLAASKDGFFQIGIQSAGTGQSANPTVTFTFLTAFTSPRAIIVQNGGSDAFGFCKITSLTTTAVTWQWLGTPVAGESYTFHGWIAELA